MCYTENTTKRYKNQIDYLEKEMLVVSRFIIAAISTRPISLLCTAPWSIRPMDTTAFERAALVISQRITVYLRTGEGRGEGGEETGGRIEGRGGE